MEFDKDLLISKVFSKNVIWDKRLRAHANRNTVDKAWREIAAEMDEEDDGSLRKKWKYLRDQFSVEVGKYPLPRSGDFGKRAHSKWPYFESLKFLLGIVKPRNTSKNLRNNRSSEYQDESVKQEDNNVKKESRPKKGVQEIEKRVSLDVLQPDDSMANSSSSAHVSRKRKLSDGNTQYNQQQLSLEEENTSLLERVANEQISASDNDDALFFRSLLPHASKIPQHLKLRYRNQVQLLVEQLAYGSANSTQRVNAQPRQQQTRQPRKQQRYIPKRFEFSSMEAARVNSEGDANDGTELHVTNSTMMSTEPVMKMRERLQALKGLQLETSNLESQFFKELHALERRYSTDFSKLYERRNEIIQGTREPETLETAEEDGVLKDIALKMSTNDQPGVPSFWLTVFRHSCTLNDLMRPYDEPILYHLRDIKIEYTENPMGFRLNFHFNPNSYFTNEVLTKEYHINSVPSPFKHDSEIYKCLGCKIDWLPNKDVTLKIGKKRQRHRTSGTVRTVERIVKTDSFFNFFDPPVVPNDPKIEVKDEVHIRLATDYEIGQYFRTRIIPHGFLYFSGQVPELDDNYQDIETETSEESSSDSEED